jgi:hypothetical protein
MNHRYTKKRNKNGRVEVYNSDSGMWIAWLMLTSSEQAYCESLTESPEYTGRSDNCFDAGSYSEQSSSYSSASSDYNSRSSSDYDSGSSSDYSSSSSSDSGGSSGGGD